MNESRVLIGNTSLQCIGSIIGSNDGSRDTTSLLTGSSRKSKFTTWFSLIHEERSLSLLQDRRGHSCFPLHLHWYMSDWEGELRETYDSPYVLHQHHVSIVVHYHSVGMKSQLLTKLSLASPEAFAETDFCLDVLVFPSCHLPQL